MTQKKWDKFRDKVKEEYETIPESEIVKRYETDYSYRCVCNKYWDKPLNDHIHPVEFKDGSKGYYCGECGYRFKMEVAIRRDKI